MDETAAVVFGVWHPTLGRFGQSSQPPRNINQEFMLWDGRPRPSTEHVGQKEARPPARPPARGRKNQILRLLRMEPRKDGVANEQPGWWCSGAAGRG